MLYYTVHARTGEGPQKALLVKDGFSWPALLLGPFWLLWKRCWLASFAVLALAMALTAAGEQIAGWGFLAIQLVLGFEGNDIWRRALERRGYEMKGIVAARDMDEAELRWSRAMTGIAAAGDA